MAHILCFAEARDMYLRQMLTDIERQRYVYRKGKQFFETQANCREIKIFDITLPQDAMPYLLNDLAPFWSDQDVQRSLLKGKMEMAAEAIRLMTGLKPLIYNPEPTYNIRKHWVNLVPIGWKPDRHEDDKGELI